MNNEKNKHCCDNLSMLEDLFVDNLKYTKNKLDEFYKLFRQVVYFHFLILIGGSRRASSCSSCSGIVTDRLKKTQEYLDVSEENLNRYKQQ